jgi:hypothetical protein
MSNYRDETGCYGDEEGIWLPVHKLLPAYAEEQIEQMITSQQRGNQGRGRGKGGLEMVPYKNRTAGIWGSSDPY